MHVYASTGHIILFQSTLYDQNFHFEGKNLVSAVPVMVCLLWIPAIPKRSCVCRIRTDTDRKVCSWPWQYFALGKADPSLFITNHGCIKLKNSVALVRERTIPPLWSRGQSFWLQIQRSRVRSRRYQIFWVVVGLERGPLSLVRSNWGATWIKKVAAPGSENRY